MRRIIAASAILLLLNAPGCAATGSEGEPQITPEPEKTQPLKVTVATWNVHNLFDTICDSGACGSGNYEPEVSDTYYRSKLTNVVRGIQTIAADVVLLQEIEKESNLNDIQATIGTQNYPSAVFGETGRTASVDVGILTRGKITAVHTYRDNYWIDQTDGSQKRLARELLAAEITLPNGGELTAFTTHFVSKATDSVGDRRLGEAVLTQQILAEYIAQHPNRLIVFGGDLNDTPDSAPMQALAKDGILENAFHALAPGQVTTWNDSVTFDHLYYPAALSQQLEKAETLCDEERKNGFSSSDHCAVKATFRLVQ